MIHGLADWIASIFISYGESDEEDKDIYVYACEMVISTIVNVMLGLLVAALLGRLLDGIIFITGFALLRRYTGGYHAKTHFRCILAFALILTCGMITLDYISGLQIESMVLAIAGIVSVGICLLAPVEHKNKPLDIGLRKSIKKKSCWAVSALWVFSAVDLYIVGTGIALSLLLSMFFVFGSMAYAVVISRSNFLKGCSTYEK